MTELNVKVNVTPWDALELVKQELDAKFVYQEAHDMGDGRWIGTVIAEKFYMRVESRVGMVLIADNLYGATSVRCIPTGSSQGFFHNYDFGAASHFTAAIRKILTPYIVE